LTRRRICTCALRRLSFTKYAVTQCKDQRKVHYLDAVRRHVQNSWSVRVWAECSRDTGRQDRIVLSRPFFCPAFHPGETQYYGAPQKHLPSRQENYLKTQPVKVRNLEGPPKMLKQLELMDQAASSISDADLVDALIHG
jgi:hypothetical protein